ncbi:MAG TPA: hypothetical protein VIX17_14135 [Pyrinomonadaceae bacterium]|jgi:hypothetical protein
MITPRSKAAGALYYPYIHIKDLNWLLSNLIIFPCIKRMVPMHFIPRDSNEVRALSEWVGDQEPLLQPAYLFSPRAEQAQSNLAGKLKRDAQNDEFVRSYGQAAASELRHEKDYGFQIHVQKLSRELKDALAHTQLAWNPINKEPYDQHSEYVELHPRVGEAVMSTLAIACAQDDGLDIVGDRRTGQLHRCLLEKRLDTVYESWLGLETNLEPPQAASGEELMEFMVGMTADLSTLSVDAIRDLVAEREAIDDLITALREEATKIPTMGAGNKREDFFKQASTKIMEKWESDRNNLSNFWSAFFGQDTAKLASSFATTVADKTLTGFATGTLGAAGKAAITASIAGSAANAGWIGALATGGIIGAGAGLIIGLVAHTGVTYHRQAQRAKNSPYRFLTTLETTGVLCRF